MRFCRSVSNRHAMQSTGWGTSSNCRQTPASHKNDIQRTFLHHFGYPWGKSWLVVMEMIPSALRRGDLVIGSCDSFYLNGFSAIIWSALTVFGRIVRGGIYFYVFYVLMQVLNKVYLAPKVPSVYDMKYSGECCFHIKWAIFSACHVEL